MSHALSLPFRQVHLDFHTGPDVPDVGAAFDARAFVETMTAAHVNSVTVFAKCHHGHLYYDTSDAARHPKLVPGLDLLGEQVNALHAAGIRAPIYLSVQCDEYAANAHPEWVCQSPDGKPVGPGPFGAGWQILDMNSPYADYVAAQLAEVLTKFAPVDGLFFDMCWDQPTSSPYAVEAMLKGGLDPEDESHRRRHAHAVAMRYMKRYFDQVKASSPEAGVYFNSRPLHNLAEELPYLSQVEIEALPTGGWGYTYFPKNVRFARNFPREYLGMTARFHRSWGDFGGLKPYPALEYETSQMIAHGARCSVGDQLHPSGRLDGPAYELIGRAYARVAAREPWLVGAKAVTDIGVFQAGVPRGDAIVLQNAVDRSDEGATRLLTQLKCQFDVVDFGTDLSAYRLLILPDAIEIDAKGARTLRDYLARGGKLLATGRSGLSEDRRDVVLAELGIRAEGDSPFTTTYVRFDDSFADVPRTDHVVHDRGLRVRAAGGGGVVARVVEPYFERSWKHFCSHAQTPPRPEPSEYAAAVVTESTAYVSFPVFSSFARHGSAMCRQMMRALIDQLLPDPLVRVETPSSTEVTVMRQGARQIVHLLQYCAERRADGLDLIEDVVPLSNVAVSLRTDGAIRQVSIAPEGTRLDHRLEAGRVHVVLPELGGHAMIVVE